MTVNALCRQILVSPGYDRLRELVEGESLDTETLNAIVSEAENFSHKVLRPINSSLDHPGCILSGERVITAPGHRQAWDAYVRDGWPTLDQPVLYGGQNLPSIVMTACQELFERENVAFGMLPTAQRASVALLIRHASPDLIAEWAPPLVRGDWGATICISESGAGSDVLRIRTSAIKDADGAWIVSGEKNWISFGDHDLTHRIGHCLLARTGPGAAISLFLVPNTFKKSDGYDQPNGVHVTRLESKLGLHGSPTCAIQFNRARAFLIGEPGRGLAQIFTMITKMRLSVAVQGLGLAGRATEHAVRYAHERRQGGPLSAPPVAIVGHYDVQRMLMDMTSRVIVLRGLLYALTTQIDLGEREVDESARDDAISLAQWLLPIAKTLASEAAFDIASEALQVFGGAGYVTDSPIEQLLRDSRVFAVYEGTTGMQALDLFRRRLLHSPGRRGLEVFQQLASDELRRTPQGAMQRSFADTLDQLNAMTTFLTQPGLQHSEAAATPFLQLAGLAAMSWIALRTTNLSGDDSLVAGAQYWLIGSASKADYLRAQISQAITRASLVDRLIVDARGPLFGCDPVGT